MRGAVLHYYSITHYIFMKVKEVYLENEFLKLRFNLLGLDQMVSQAIHSLLARGSLPLT